MLLIILALIALTMQHYGIYDFNEHWWFTLALAFYASIYDFRGLK